MGDVYCFGKYVGVLKDAIVDYKFHGSLWLGKKFGKLVYDSFHNTVCKENYDFITYVPVSKSGYKKRGFDQCLEIVKTISNESGLPLKKVFCCSSLKVKQSKLSRSGRSENVKGKFRLISDDIEAFVRGKKIILFDDILTTGSTLKECGDILINCGATKVDALVIATGRADLIKKLE